MTQLLLCSCGTRRRPLAWPPKGRKSHARCLRCPSCGFSGGDGFADENVRERWNEAVRVAHERAQGHHGG